MTEDPNRSILIAAYGQDKPSCKPHEHDIHPCDDDPLEPFKCSICGTTFRKHWLENVEGKWRMEDYPMYSNKSRRRRR
jgi:hypothetical protein